MHQPLTADLNPADEVVAVYDRTGNPIGRAPRSVVYSGGLWHASAGVLVRTGDGSRIYVHRRTDTKAVFGGYLDCLAGGVVDPGVTLQENEIRAVGEELGIFGTEDRKRTRLNSSHSCATLMPYTVCKKNLSTNRSLARNTLGEHIRNLINKL